MATERPDRKSGRVSVMLRLDPETVRLLTEAAEEAGRSRNNFIANWLDVLADVHERGSLEDLRIDLHIDEREGVSPYDPVKMLAAAER